MHTASFPSIKQVVSAGFLPKATFLKGLCSTWGFNSVILPKNAGKKWQVTSLLGLEPWGNPSMARGDAGGTLSKAGAEVLGCPAVAEPAC